ncbi:uncharacterized protein LOC123557490 [Mercenaria mercenaria]|uniref:uncharacterized protein LOC123557490 n=1 Tax=Mercenaria mercenaria TaxID=6596 RepID=UPI00234E65D7|nr:uncharacterized protein LOC123557490 [Mercenaria mercenaria]XP_045204906.2 uncharacterized protein LOC123557490 [Mercenaria mercenaria]
MTSISTPSSLKSEPLSTKTDSVEQGPEPVHKHVVKRVQAPKQEELDFIKRTCDPCKFENKESKAQGFCRVCREYLCEKCEKFHRKFQATRSHKIVHGVLMPKPVKKSMTTCEYHKNNPVEYFCKDHGDVICLDCKELKHKICNSVVSIEFFGSTEIDKREFEKVKQEMKTVVEDFKNVLVLRKQDLTDLEEERDKCRNAIKDIRDDFNTLLDKLEEELQNEVKTIYGNEVQIMRDHVEMCEKAMKTLNGVIENVTEVKKTEDNIATFAMFTKAKRKLTDYEKVLKDVKREAYIPEIDIIRDQEVVESLKKIVTLGETKVKTIPKAFHISLSNLKKENMRVVETLVHSVRMPGDDNKHDCEITGSAFLDNGTLVICDKHNYKVKLLERHFQCKYDFELNGAPWDVAVVNDKWVVATLPFVKKLQFLHADIFEGITKGRTIETDRMCWGVAVSKEDILISCHDNPGNGKIHVLDKRGHTKKIIGPASEDSAFMLEMPSYLAVSFEGEKVFVADGDVKPTVTCLSRKNGQIIYDYCASNFGYSMQTNVAVYQNPWSFKIIVDKDDYVFANLGDKEMIQVITDTGVKHSTLLRNTEQLFGPHTMSYRESDATLIIGLWDQIQSFRFKEIEIKT